MPEFFVEQGTQEWLDLRKGRITASIAAACLGLDPDRSRQWAWREVLGTNKQYQPNKHQNWGTEHEERAALDYMALTGNLIDKCGFFTHPTLPWLGASPDRKVRPKRLVEIKCPKVLPVSVPVKYAIQMLVQLACTEFNACDFYAWHDMGNYYTEELTPDYLIATEQGVLSLTEIIDGLEAFRDKYVLTGIEPERKTRTKKGKKDADSKPGTEAVGSVPQDA